MSFRCRTVCTHQRQRFSARSKTEPGRRWRRATGTFAFRWPSREWPPTVPWRARMSRSQAGSIGPTSPRAIWEPGRYVREVPKLFEHLRAKLGDEVELLHDVHERISPSQAIKLCKDLEPYRPVLRRGPASARGKRSLPTLAAAMCHADRDGGAVQHAA